MKLNKFKKLCAAALLLSAGHCMAMPTADRNSLEQELREAAEQTLIAANKCDWNKHWKDNLSHHFQRRVIKHNGELQFVKEEYYISALTPLIDVPDQTIKIRDLHSMCDGGWTISYDAPNNMEGAVKELFGMISTGKIYFGHCSDEQLCNAKDFLNHMAAVFVSLSEQPDGPEKAYIDEVAKLYGYSELLTSQINKEFDEHSTMGWEEVGQKKSNLIFELLIFFKETLTEKHYGYDQFSIPSNEHPQGIIETFLSAIESDGYCCYRDVQGLLGIIEGYNFIKHPCDITTLKDATEWLSYFYHYLASSKSDSTFGI
ncbi:hypothetical protein HOD08_04810 [bacterium]|nr:hypothetical protein [bacterium]